MSDSFDPNFFLNLSKFDESAFYDETFTQKDDEIDDAELLVQQYSFFHNYTFIFLLEGT